MSAEPPVTMEDYFRSENERLKPEINRLRAFKQAYDSISGNGWLQRAHALPGRPGDDVWHNAVERAERLGAAEAALKKAEEVVFAQAETITKAEKALQFLGIEILRVQKRADAAEAALKKAGEGLRYARKALRAAGGHLGMAHGCDHVEVRDAIAAALSSPPA